MFDTSTRKQSPLWDVCLYWSQEEERHSVLESLNTHITNDDEGSDLAKKGIAWTHVCGPTTQVVAIYSCFMPASL